MASKPMVNGRGNAYKAVAVTPNDSTDLTDTGAALYVGTGGDVAVHMADGSDVSVVFSSVPDGTFLPILVDRVLSTNTTASNILALY